MPEFFTVATEEISKLEELNLLEIEKSIFTKNDGYFSLEETERKLNSLFSNGISYHGKQYLLDQCLPVYDNAQKAYFPHMPMIELIFELTRQIKFNDKPSRFESIFGCETLEEAKQFRQNRRNNNFKIYKVSAESYFKADMHLLSATSIAGNMVLAEKYWNGESSKNPFWEILMKPPVKILSEVE